MVVRIGPYNYGTFSLAVGPVVGRISAKKWEPRGCGLHSSITLAEEPQGQLSRVHPV